MRHQILQKYFEAALEKRIKSELGLVLQYPAGNAHWITWSLIFNTVFISDEVSYFHRQ